MQNGVSKLWDVLEYNFSLEELGRLNSIMLELYGIHCTIHSTNESNRGGLNSYYLYIRSQSRLNFISLVKPHMHSSMMYKLGV